MKLTIKITDGKTWDDETPLEFDIEDARKLWIELSKIFNKYELKPNLVTDPSEPYIYCKPISVELK